jgi:sugar lactone lactonase YvrE
MRTSNLALRRNQAGPLVTKLMVVLVGFASLGSLRADPYSFTTIAGLAGQAGHTDGTNSGALFHNPGGVAVDGAGNVYVADTLNHTIRQLAPSGTNWVVTTIAGVPTSFGTNDGLGSVAKFFLPYGVAIDGATNLYVADTSNHAIRKLVFAGGVWFVSTWAGSPRNPGFKNATGTSAQFNTPSGIAADTAGNVFVADTANNAIRQISPAGSVTTVAGGASGFTDGTNTAARFNQPDGVAVDAAGSLYVADSGNSTVRKVTPYGTNWVVSTLAGLPELPGSSDGTNFNALFNLEFGLCVGSGDTLFVADTDNYTLRKVTPVGTNWVVNTIGGQPGNPGSADGSGALAQFNFPHGVAMDSSGKLYVADTSNDTIRLGQVTYLLQAARFGNQLVLSWPGAATNFVLETTSGVGPQGPPWTPLSTGVFLSGPNFVRTNAIGTGPAFFRLHKP